MAVFFQDSFGLYIDWNAILGLLTLQTQHGLGGDYFKIRINSELFNLELDGV